LPCLALFCHILSYLELLHALYSFSCPRSIPLSIAYAIEAALRALDGNLALLLPTMGLVVAIIGLITINYHQLVARFPDGGGSAAAFGEAWAFVPIGALIVDFVLTIAISVAASASAVVAYFPLLSGVRVVIAFGLLRRPKNKQPPT
jgi:hypothetical protein